MLFYTGLAFLVIAVSLDGFGVGISYGMRKIIVPNIALLIIMLCSGIVILISMTVGHMLHQVISPQNASILGGVILILLGLFSLVNLIRSKQTPDVSSRKEKVNRFTTILMKPDKADWDASGTISSNEALILGIALSLDAFGAGIGASIIGYSPIITPILISLMSGLFVFSGLKIGLLLSKSKQMQKISFIAPLLLIILGILNML